mmetsp:Transcript_42682/g.111212  ORF Transcript_42682/g.111212 Transcript_42682/m.111212 type:complete len:204 (-) Transcript_42682:683-1294(-)
MDLFVELLSEDKEAERDEADHASHKADRHRAARVVQRPLAQGVVQLRLRHHGVHARLAGVLAAGGLETSLVVHRAPPKRVLCFLPPPEVRHHDGPDADEYAERGGGEVVWTAMDHGPDLERHAEDGDWQQPLQVERLEDEIECNFVAEVISDRVGELFFHEVPVQRPVHQLREKSLLVQREVCLYSLVLHESPDVVPCAILVR